MSKVTDGFEEKAFKIEELGYTWKFLDVMSLLEHARALEAMLRKHEWANEGNFCPECEGRIPGKGWEYPGHAPDCDLAKLLEGE